MEMHGYLAVIGAPQDDIGSHMDRGSVYIYAFNGINWIQQQKLTAIDGKSGDDFGASVDISEDYIVVGSPLDSIGNSRKGSVYIFSFNGTQWVQQQKLAAADGATDDEFGRSVSVSGSRVIVGAPKDDSLALNNKGSAYVFNFNGSTWIQAQKLKASDAGSADEFGNSLSLYGNNVLIGASRHVINACQRGAVYHFEFSSGHWVEEQILQPGNNQCNSFFGTSVDVHGTKAIIGANGHNSGEGIAYVFLLNNNSWNEHQQLYPDDNAFSAGLQVSISDSFVLMTAYDDVYLFRNINNYWLRLEKVGGSAILFEASQPVALYGDRFMVGDLVSQFYTGRATFGKITDFDAWQECTSSNISEYNPLAADDGSSGDLLGHSVSIDSIYAISGAAGDNFGKGAAYIYQLVDDRWIQKQKLTASDGLNDDYFGQTVYISGDYAIVGAPGDKIGSNNGQGSAYVFFYNGTSWIQQQKLTSSDGAPFDYFGYCVSIYGSKALIGAPFKTISGHSGTGAAYLFTRTGTTWTQTDTIVHPQLHNQALFGWYVSISADRMVAGAPGDDLGSGPNQGAAFVFLSSSPFSLEATLTPVDGASGNYFGIALSLAGSQLLVGAPSADSEKGTAYAYSRNGTVWSQTQRIPNPEGELQDYFGSQISLDGNFALIGAFTDNVNGMEDMGSAYVYQNINSLWMPLQHVVDPTGVAENEFGYACGLSGQRFVIGSKNAADARGLIAFGKIK